MSTFPFSNLLDASACVLIPINVLYSRGTAYGSLDGCSWVHLPDRRSRAHCKARRDLLQVPGKNSFFSEFRLDYFVIIVAEDTTCLLQLFLISKNS